MTVTLLSLLYRDINPVDITLMTLSPLSITVMTATFLRLMELLE